MTGTVCDRAWRKSYVAEQNNELSKGHNRVTVLDVFGWGDEEKKESPVCLTDHSDYEDLLCQIICFV